MDRQNSPLYSSDSRVFYTESSLHCLCGAWSGFLTYLSASLASFPEYHYCWNFWTGNGLTWYNNGYPSQLSTSLSPKRRTTLRRSEWTKAMPWATLKTENKTQTLVKHRNSSFSGGVALLLCTFCSHLPRRSTLTDSSDVNSGYTRARCGPVSEVGQLNWRTRVRSR